MIVIELIYNLSLLVSLSVLSGFIDSHFERTSYNAKALQGLLFGITAVIGMMFPFVLIEGLIFDGRSVVISLCTLFFGPVSGIIASIFAVAFRVYLGGTGTIMGVLVVFSSFAIGYYFHRRKLIKKLTSKPNLNLYLFGLIVHVVMLLFVLTLPSELIMPTYLNIGFTVLIIYPLITLIIGKILIDQENKHAIHTDLIESESIFRSLAESSPSAIFIYQREKFVYVNPAAYELTGYSKEELVGRDFWSIVHPHYKELVRSRGLRRQSGDEIDNRYRFKIVHKSGEPRWVDFSSTLIEYKDNPAGLGTAYDITSLITSLETLQEQKELFQTTIYSIGDAIITTGLHGKIKQMNHIAEKLTGWTETEAVEKPLENVFKVINENTRRKVENPFEKVIKEGKIVGLANHTLLISKDGTEIPIADSGAPIKNNNGETIGVVLVFRDQSVERAAEQKLRESEERFRQLVNSAFDGIYLMEDKKYTFVNDRFCEMTGYSKDELLSDSFDVNYLLTERGKETVWKRYEARKRGEEIPATYEFEIQSKQGEIKEVEISTVSIGDPGRIAIIGIMRDISDRRSAEEELRKSKERMQVLIEGTPHLFFYVQDNEGKIKYVSPSVEKITGHTIEEWLGEHHWFMTDHPINNIVHKRTKEHLQGNFDDSPIVGEIRHKDGRKLWLEVYEKPIIKEGKVTGLQGVAHDITDKKAAERDLTEAKEKAEKSDRLKSDFLAQVSHEIRSPLNAVINFSALIKDETSHIKSEELEISFAGIESASRRVIRTIDLILNMSELQLGTYQASFRNFDLVEVLRILKTEYATLAKSKGLKFTFTANLDAAELITDEYAVNQIFANLIDNAIKYTKNGFVKIDLSKNENGEIVVKIIDSGMGISSEYLATIFDPFTQEEQGYSRRFEGSGLGMSLVKKYSEIIGVSIDVESKKGEGTTFIVVFPKNK